MKTYAAPRGIFAILALLVFLAAAAPPQPNPFDQQIAAIQPGSAMPDVRFIDQHGDFFTLPSLRGRTTVVGFIYTRCADACPIITQKFGALNNILGAGPFELVEVSIDPSHDTVPVIKTYAKKFGVAWPRWRLATGDPATVKNFVRAAGISVIDNGKGELVHNAELLIVDPDGRLATVDQQVAWDPQTVAAELQHVAGNSGSLLGRVNFALTSTVAQLCGGSYRTASSVIDVVATLLLIGGGVFVLGWMRHRILAQGG